MPQRIEFEDLHQDVRVGIASLALLFAMKHPEFLHVQLTWNGIQNSGEPVVDVITSLGTPVVDGPPRLYAVPDLVEDET